VTYVQATGSGNTNASSTTISVECPSNAPYVLLGYATWNAGNGQYDSGHPFDFTTNARMANRQPEAADDQYGWIATVPNGGLTGTITAMYSQ
jgi:hypothetical protein